MKSKARGPRALGKLGLCLGVFSAGMFLSQGASAAVTFTNTPAAVSNTYTGPITLQIGGLTNKEAVVIQKFLDANTNGVIDGGDMLMQQFNVTDGTNFVIGGVTNFNVPGDLNTTTGAITATLNFQSGDFAQTIVGKYLYKLSSPVGHFAPLTNRFSVTNFPYLQKFTGNVVSNSTSTTVPRAFVVLFPPPRPGHNGPGQPVAGTVANNSGAYSIQVPPGTYTLMALGSNFVSDFNKAPVLTLGSGATINTNLTMTNATASITGKMVDAGNTNIGLPGILMPASSTNGLVAITSTDTNGNFTERVTAGQWSLGSDNQGLIAHGYVGWNNGTNANAGATGVLVAYPKATALFYGSVKDVSGNPLAGIDIYAYDYTSNSYSMDGFTDTNGNYVVGALGLGSSDFWQLGVSSDTTPTNYIISQPQFDQNGGTNLVAGQAVLQNFTARLATNTISGTVKDNNNNPISNVQVYAYTTIGGEGYQAGIDTDVNGHYSINVANGTWMVNLYCYGGNDSLGTNYLCPNSVTVTIANNNVVTNFVVQQCAGVSISTASLPVGEVNLWYDQFLYASSCYPSFTWTNTSGSGALPPGLTLGSNGELFGVPSGNGFFTFTVQVTDGNNATTNQQLSVLIDSAVQITTASLPDGTNGAAYSQQLQASDGLPYNGTPYSWSLWSGGLPPNLNLATNGLLSGTLATSGLFNFIVQASDSLGGAFQQPLSLNIVNTNKGSLPPLSVGSAAGQIIVLWPASAGTNFTVLMTTNLTNGVWVPATNGVPVISFLFSNTLPAAFFRLQ